MILIEFSLKTNEFLIQLSLKILAYRNPQNLFWVLLETRETCQMKGCRKRFSSCDPTKQDNS